MAGGTGHIIKCGVSDLHKAGWQVSTLSTVEYAFLAVVLLVIGAIFYKEPLSWNKIVGVIICLVGLGFINHS